MTDTSQFPTSPLPETRRDDNDEQEQDEEEKYDSLQRLQISHPSKLDTPRIRVRPTKPSTPNSSCSDIIISFDDNKDETNDGETPEPRDATTLSDIHADPAPHCGALTTQSQILDALIDDDKKPRVVNSHLEQSLINQSLETNGKFKLLKMTVDFKVEWSEPSPESIQVSAQCDSDFYIRNLTLSMLRKLGFPHSCSVQTIAQFIQYALYSCLESPGRQIRSDTYGGTISLSYQRYESDGILEIEIIHDVILQVKQYVIRLKKMDPSSMTSDGTTTASETTTDTASALLSALNSGSGSDGGKSRSSGNSSSSSSNERRTRILQQSRSPKKKKPKKIPPTIKQFAQKKNENNGNNNGKSPRSRRKRRTRKKGDKSTADHQSRHSEQSSKKSAVTSSSSASSSSASSSSSSTMNNTNMTSLSLLSDSVNSTSTRKCLTKLLKEVSSLRKQFKDTEKLRLREEREMRRDIEQLKIVVNSLSLHHMHPTTTKSTTSFSSSSTKSNNNNPEYHSKSHSQSSSTATTHRSRHQQAQSSDFTHHHNPDQRLLYPTSTAKRKRKKHVQFDRLIRDENGPDYSTEHQTHLSCADDTSVIHGSSTSAGSTNDTPAMIDSSGKSSLCDRCKCDLVPRNPADMASQPAHPSLMSAPVMSSSVPVVPPGGLSATPASATSSYGLPGCPSSSASLAMAAAAAAAASASSSSFGLPPPTPAHGTSGSPAVASYSSLPASMSNTLLNDPVCYSCGCLFSAHIGGFCPGQF